jgi:hypothetical protein
VRHPGGDVKGDLDVGGGGLPGQADGVVEEDLVGSGLDDQGWQAGQVGEDGADQAEGGVVSGGVVGDPGLEVFPAEQRVGLGLGVHGGPGQGEIGVRGHNKRRGRQREPVVAGVDKGGDGEPAAGRLAGERDAGRVGAVVQEGLVGGQGVVDRGRVGVFGGEPVVHGDDRGAGPPADLGGQAGGLDGVSQDVHAAVEVQDDMAGFGSVDGDLGGGDAAQGGWGDGDAGRQRLRRCQLREPPPQLADIEVGGEG